MEDIISVKEVEEILGGDETTELETTDSSTENIEESTDVENNSELETEDTSTENVDEEANTEDKIEEVDGTDLSVTDAIENLSDTNEELGDSKLDEMSDEELDKLLSDIEESNEEVTETISNEEGGEDLTLALKEKDATIKAISGRLDSYIKENAKLKVQNAENEIYSGNDSLEVLIMRANKGDADSRQTIIDAAKSFIKKDNIDRETNAASNAGRVQGSAPVNEAPALETYVPKITVI